MERLLTGPLYAAAVRYVRNLTDFKSGNWSDDTSSLVAFLLGYPFITSPTSFGKASIPKYQRGLDS